MFVLTIAGAGAVALLLVSMMLIGESPGMPGSLAMAVVAGVLASVVASGVAHTRRVPAGVVDGDGGDRTGSLSRGRHQELLCAAPRPPR